MQAADCGGLRDQGSAGDHRHHLRALITMRNTWPPRTACGICTGGGGATTRFQGALMRTDKHKRFNVFKENVKYVSTTATKKTSLIS
ncbi:hypothetical protein ACLB2K_049085 [Fragaria x ananassa]